MSHTHSGHTHDSMNQCIDACTNCGRLCLETLHHCLTQGGQHATAEHIGMLMDCTDICDVSARFLVRGSVMHKETCRACAAVCEACAKSCEAMPEDEVMKRCAAACRACAEECRRMSGA